MFEEKSFDYIMIGLITILCLYTVMKNNEPFSNLDNKQECSDIVINKQIFDYVLSELNQTKI